MIPVLLVSNRKADSKKFIEALAKSEKIPPYHIFHFEPETSIITIEQIREIHKFIAKSPFNKLVIIHDFDTAKSESQNAFLKTLEEHSITTFFVLICSSADGFLPTIQSRCHIVRLNSMSEIKSKNNFLEYASLEEALDASARVKKEDYIDSLNGLINDLHSKIITSTAVSPPDVFHNYSSYIRTALSLKVMMQDYNIQPEFAFDQLLIEIHTSA